MTATAAPFGLAPAYHPSGVVRPDKGSIASAYGANIYNGSPVAYVTGGGLALAAAGATKTAGVFQGVEYNTPTAAGRRIVSNYWPTGTVATDIVAYLTTDADIVYRVQCDATTAYTAIGRAYNWTTNATGNGDTATGQSTVALGVSTMKAAGTAGDMIVIGLDETEDNAWGDTYPVVLVKLGKPQFGADILPAIGT